MNRSIIFSNTALNMKKIKKISEILDNNDNIKTLNIYTSRKIKDNKIKIIDSKTFNRIDELINYIDENSIEIVEDIEINIYYKNKNTARLRYENYNHRWELSYSKQDINIDSLIFNLKPLMRNTPLKIFRQFRGWCLAILYVICMLLMECIIQDSYVLWIFGWIFVFFVIDIFFGKNVAFRENKFISRKKDDIILAIISYVLGGITTYIFNFVIDFINQNK